MIRPAFCSAIVISLAIATPKPAFADLKDALIGAAVGAAITHGVQKEKQKKKSVSVAPATLNSQYSRDERRLIQSSLNNIGLHVGAVDGSLGPKSRAAIAQFQASRGEPQTGQLTRLQFSALTGVGAPLTTAAYDRPLATNEVAMMQQSLQTLGFYYGAVDGVNGAGTQNARAGFVVSQGRNPAQTTQVQSLVLAASAAGYQVPPYLMQEAQTQMAAAAQTNPFGQPAATQNAATGFGAPQQQQQQGTLFGTPATTAAFGAQPQQQQQGAFGIQPQQQQGFGAQQPQQGFGTQQQQQAFGTQPTQQGGGFGTQPVQQQQQQTTSLFGTQQTAPQQQQLQQVPQGQQQQQQQQLLFAPQPTQPALQGQVVATAGTGGAQQTQQGLVAPQQQQSSLDIFQLAPAQQQPAATGGQQQQQPATGTAASGTLFAPTTQSAQTNNTSVFAAPSGN